MINWMWTLATLQFNEINTNAVKVRSHTNLDLLCGLFNSAPTLILCIEER